MILLRKKKRQKNVVLKNVVKINKKSIYVYSFSFVFYLNPQQDPHC